LGSLALPVFLLPPCHQKAYLDLAHSQPDLTNAHTCWKPKSLKPKVAATELPISLHEDIINILVVGFVIY
jgi:hypothetical protein